jgi:hypothetical protein
LDLGRPSLDAADSHFVNGKPGPRQDGGWVGVELVLGGGAGGGRVTGAAGGAAVVAAGGGAKGATGW